MDRKICRQTCDVPSSLPLLRVLTLLLVAAPLVEGWGSSSNNDETAFANSDTRDWLYDGSAINIKLEGCAYGAVDENDLDDLGCLGADSEDGTASWYMMANCMRAQAVFSIYAGSSGRCTSNTYKETVSLSTHVADKLLLCTGHVRTSCLTRLPLSL
jgi:hypothetical protein